MSVNVGDRARVEKFFTGIHPIAGGAPYQAA
jgi:hypothetical protein